MILNGSDILAECLVEQSVDTVFGYPGGAVLNIYDALYKYQAAGKIRHYLTSHEQGASHAADGYARATGKTGVCVATSGPGATNLVTGIATAYMDSVPMVAITGNVSGHLLGKDSFQEVDTVGITMPVTKHGFLVKDVRELADTMRRAFRIAREGRPGPVVVDITKDATADTCEYTPQEPRTAAKTLPSPALIDKAAELIGAAQKPMIYAGGGVIIANAAPELARFAELTDSPVSLSLMGLGGFPASNPRYTGMVGMHGTKASNAAVTECDLLIALGARFSDRVVSNVTRFAPNAKILHIDADAAEINKNVLVTMDIVADVKEALAALNSRLGQQNHADWMERIKGISAEYPVSYQKDGRLRPQYILERIGELTRGKAIYATDVGQHQMWAGQFLRPDEPRTFLSSGGLGTMGYGLGAAIGAALAVPDKLIFNISGDGCFRMNCIELATAVEYNLPVIDVIMNNHVLGMVRQWQTFFYGGRYSASEFAERTTDFCRLAEAYGAAAFRVTEPGQVDGTILKAIALRRPVVIDCEIWDDEKVFPMVAPGAGIDELVLES